MSSVAHNIPALLGTSFHCAETFFIFLMSHPLFCTKGMKLAFDNKNYWGKAGSTIRHTSISLRNEANKDE